MFKPRHYGHHRVPIDGAIGRQYPRRKHDACRVFTLRYAAQIATTDRSIY
jgi:hypothetical protein